MDCPSSPLASPRPAASAWAPSSSSAPGAAGACVPSS
eukprot:CAMPEP_0185197392 /NCGR_PEP_ID=MMETSP1140-20130426/40275_1 /TAXON_ID=298111 /ORGANISM="Pavlova sp., Strain CCMP459" /LENGTH=36 /DNA_ID= /DNA_START= /DNA_END= /DNA_ORIENTATION=